MDVRVGAASWAEAVFHVLAHVPDARGLPSSLYSPWYVDFVARHLGAAALRPLGEDVSVLAGGLTTHQRLASVQRVAWLWREASQAFAVAGSPLPALAGRETPGGVVAAELATDPWAAALRDAALLEVDEVARLPSPDTDPEALRAELDKWGRCLPCVADFDVLVMRALTRHGRVKGREIWVGVPGEGAAIEQVGCQVAHEAAVIAARTHGPALSEREVEAVALVLLARRVRGSATARSHRDWCEAHGVRDRDLDAGRLGPACRAALVAADG